MNCVLFAKNKIFKKCWKKSGNVVSPEKWEPCVGICYVDNVPDNIFLSHYTEFCILLARVAEKARVRTTPSDLPSTPKPLTPIKTTKEETTNQAEPVGAKSVPNLLQRKPEIRVQSPIKLKDTELGNVTEFSRNRSIIVYM